MKILFDHPWPFLLAQGGFQLQIEQTKRALESLGVEVEFLRWWDAQQCGDVIHFFSAARDIYIQQAHAARIPVVMTELFTETCNRSDAKLALQGWLTQLLLRAPFGASVKQHLPWRAYRNCDHLIVGLEAERKVLQTVYGVAANRMSVVPLGLSEKYHAAGVGPRDEPHLIYTGTITRRKNCLELARLAHAARVPILFVGKPYHESDPYWHQFRSVVDGRWVKYHPYVSEEEQIIRLLHPARGFVLLSSYENWSLSAHEAAACGLPLLLPDKKWARECFGGEAKYFSRNGQHAHIQTLQRFYEEAPRLPRPAVRLYSWLEAAQRLKQVYEQVVSTSS